MERSTKSSKFNIVFALLFVGVLLSFSLFFSMTTVMRPESNLSPDYLNDAGGLDESDFYAYDNACLKNGIFHSMIARTEYRFFGNIRRGEIIRGKNDFLFKAGQNSMGYDYITDYVGGYELTDGELELFKELVTTRQKVYENQGRYYVLAVIPNSQTVYSEYMPTYFGNISENTVLSQITEYMEKMGVECFVDLTEALSDAKSYGVLYNNTENSVNALGGYFIYSSLMSSIPEEILDRARMLELSEFDYYTHSTDGKTFAVEAGLSELISNETVSISNTTEFKYTVVNYTGGIESTFAKSAYRSEVPLNPYVLLECSNEWDKIQLMPYFSNTFGVSSYKVGHGYDGDVVARSNPLVVIQTVHEDELSEFINTELNREYLEALENDITPYKTGLPASVQYTVISEDSICVSGRIESDAEVQIFGDGFETVTARGIDGMFFAKVVFDGNANGHEVFLSAKSPDKAVSDLVTLTINGVNNVGSARDVLIGGNSMLYSTDYEIAYELPPERELGQLEFELYNLFSGYSQVNNAPDTKVMFAMLPKKLSVYRDGMPEELIPQLESLDGIKAKFSEILKNAGALPIDLSVPLREMTDGNKLFAQTSEMITDMAYYLMYCEIINNIATYEKGMTPVRAEKFREYSVPLSAGNLSMSLGFRMGYVTEIITSFNFVGNKMYFYNMDGSFVSYSADPTLPSAVIVYDDLSEPIIDLLTPHFSVAYVMSKNDTNITPSVLSAIKPDYVIYLCDEGNIDFVIRD